MEPKTYPALMHCQSNNHLQTHRRSMLHFGNRGRRQKRREDYSCTCVSTSFSCYSRSLKIYIILQQFPEAKCAVCIVVCVCVCVLWEFSRRPLSGFHSFVYLRFVIQQLRHTVVGRTIRPASDSYHFRKQVQMHPNRH
jgi:hypothetical protein